FRTNRPAGASTGDRSPVQYFGAGKRAAGEAKDIAILFLEIAGDGEPATTGEGEGIVGGEALDRIRTGGMGDGDAAHVHVHVDESVVGSPRNVIGQRGRVAPVARRVPIAGAADPVNGGQQNALFERLQMQSKRDQAP